MTAIYPITESLEKSAESALREVVLHKLALGLYDPLQSRRPRLPVAAFEIELLELDGEDAVAHAAGPLVLETANGPVEQYLRVSVPVEIFDGECRVDERREIRAAYIVDLGTETGACKETAALANE